MSWRRVQAIYRKDLRDALRDSRLLLALVMPLLLGLLYSVMFQDDTRPEAKMGYVTAAASQLPQAVKAAAKKAVILELVSADDETDLRRVVAGKDVDVGLVIPAGFDRDVAAGRAPRLTVLLPASPSFGGDYVAASIDQVVERLAGHEPAAAIERVQLPADDGSTEAALLALGQRRVFILFSLILLLAMIAAYGLPTALTEETEKHTLEALTLIASTGEVIAAKAIFGLTYCLASVPLMLAVTRELPADLALFGADMVLTALVLVGFGLCLGSLFRTQTQLSTWSGLFLLPLLAPAFTIGFPTPPFVNAILFVIPTSQTMRLGVNAFAGREVFGGEALSFAILAVWTVAAYGFLWWWLLRREAD